MALRFRCNRQRSAQTSLASIGRATRMRPLVDLSVTGPAGTRVLPALVDTGSDDIIPIAEAAVLGVDLSRAASGTFSGVGSAGHVVRFAPVTLRLTDGVEFREWPAVVGFSAVFRDRGLFGVACGLESFTATLRGDAAEFDLAVDSRYPGT